MSKGLCEGESNDLLTGRDSDRPKLPALSPLDDAMAVRVSCVLRDDAAGAPGYEHASGGADCGCFFRGTRSG